MGLTAHGRRSHEADIVDDAVDFGLPDDRREPVAGGRIGEVEGMERAGESFRRVAGNADDGVSLFREAV